MEIQNLYIEAVFSFDEVRSANGEQSPAIPLFSQQYGCGVSGWSTHS